LKLYISKAMTAWSRVVLGVQYSDGGVTLCELTTTVWQCIFKLLCELIEFAFSLGKSCS
jgi:hypothetical protein